MEYPHELLGRRYAFADRSGPDFTIVSYNTADDSCYVHALADRAATKGQGRVVEESRQHLRLSAVVRGIRRGALVESTLAPFVFARENK